VYVGFGRLDLNVRPSAFEYVFVSGREIVVAQSRRSLAKMLSAAKNPVSLANRVLTRSVSEGSVRINA
jgi:hypothetical protein